ncbi:MAG: TrbI/VirB10 family protein [Pseudoxanthomonas sp.]
MSPNTPPLPPQAAGPGHQGGPHNPYFGTVAADEAAELDTGAPDLRNEEGQRLNRRALLFLGGILVLILAMGAMFLLSFRSNGQRKPEEALRREQKPSVPEAPVVEAPALATAATAAAAQAAVPPLPLAEEPREYGLGREPPRERKAQGLSLVDRRIADSGGTAGEQDGAGALAGAAAGLSPIAPGEPGVQPPIKAQLADVSAANYLHKPDTLLLRGSYIRCVLETHIVTDLSGFTSCVVTEPVYSVNGRTLLLPKGSKIVGSYAGGGGRTDRVAVVWDRITTPNGLDVLMSSPGVDNLGGAGHPGDLDNHWPSRIASALMISLIADVFKYEGEKHGPVSTTMSENGTVSVQPYQSETARTAERLADQMLQQQMSRSPTVTINQGTVLNVYVAKDVDFSDVLGAMR